jgi:hypothetical protein
MTNNSKRFPEKPMAIVLFMTTAVAVLLSLKAVLSFDRSYDYLAYHLPFALRHFGLTTFTPDSSLMKRFDGFPPLAHLAQGLLVKVTGRLSLANSIGLIGLVAVGLCARRVYEKFSLLVWIALLCSIPLIVTHAACGYIDLWTGCPLAVAFLGLELMQSERWKEGASLFIAGLTVAWFSKYQAWPVAVALIGAATWTLFIGRLRHHALAPKLIFFTLPAVLLLAWPLRNAIKFGNPTYPAKPPLFRVNQAEPAAFEMALGQVPLAYKDWPRPLVFLASALELPRWTAPQKRGWSHSQGAGGQENPHHRMGGWFLSFPIFLALGFMAWRKGRISSTMASAFLGAVAIVATLPQSHELRYWMFIPLTLSVIAARELTGAEFWQSKPHRGLAIAVAVSIPIVLVGTSHSWLSLKIRTPEQSAPAAAKEYWRFRVEGTPAQVDVIHEDPGQAIYWAGPQFSSFTVVNEVDPLDWTRELKPTPSVGHEGR